MTTPYDPTDLPVGQQSLPPPATVTVGPIAATDTLSLFQQVNNNGVMTDYHIEGRYEYDYRRYMMGVTSPGGFTGGTAAFVMLAAPTLLWIVDWTAEKVGDSHITIPSPTTNDDEWVLLDKHCEPAKVILKPDGVTRVWRISGTYVYGHQNPEPGDFSNVRFPRPPDMNIPGGDRTVDPADLMTNLIDSE